MRIHLYTQSLNEAAVLGFFFRHYDPFVERYVVFDDGSTDATLDLLAQHDRVEVRRFERVFPDSFVKSAQALHNSAWKESRGKADWVIITAIDEHLYHPQFASYLDRCRAAGVTLIPALGHDMVAVDFPPADSLLCESLTQGVTTHWMNKLSLFDPNAIVETNFTPGRHKAAPIGKTVFPARDDLLLFHYKHLGIEYLLDRQQLLAGGLGPSDLSAGFGRQYLMPDAQKANMLKKLLGGAFDVTAQGRDHHALHNHDRWWRLPYRFIEVPEQP